MSLRTLPVTNEIYIQCVRKEKTHFSKRLLKISGIREKKFKIVAYLNMEAKFFEYENKRKSLLSIEASKWQFYSLGRKIP